MRQIWITKAGGPDVLQMRQAPSPALRSGEVRLRVEACGVNFPDILGRMGLFPSAPPLPYVPGLEVAGTIELVGQGVPDLKEGDKVFALTRYNGYSDVVAVSARRVYRRLDWMSPEHGAALPVSYLTAYQMLVVVGSVGVGDKVLIHSAASGVGLAALDICRILGAQTYGTASPEKHDFLRERGLDHPIDYRNFDYERVVSDLTGGKGVQVVLDALGGYHWRKNYRLLGPTGRLICYGTSDLASGRRRSWLRAAQFWLARPFFSPLQLMDDNKGVIGVDLTRLWEQDDAQREWMAQLVTWYDEALFRPHVDRTFKLSRAADAHHYIQERKNIGKVLLIP